MQPRTEVFINRVVLADWLHPATIRRPINNARLVHSWSEAIGSFVCEDMDDLTNEMRNRLSRATLSMLDANAAAWNSLAAEWRFRFRDAVEKKAKKLLPKSIDHDRFPAYVSSAIMMAALETEFAEYSPHRFFREWCDWLLNGYLACGWDGDIEQGQFVLFDMVASTGKDGKRFDALAEPAWEADSPVSCESFWASPTLATAADRVGAMTEFVHQMLGVKWFRGVGKPLINPPAFGQRVMGWDEAWVRFFDDEFAAARTDHASQLEATVKSRGPQAIEDWDRLRRLWKNQFEAAVRKAIRESVPSWCHRQSVNDAIQHQLQYGALEAAFADMAPNRFFRDWSYWLWRGYFPAEWHGNPPPAWLAECMTEGKSDESHVDFGVM